MFNMNKHVGTAREREEIMAWQYRQLLAKLRQARSLLAVMSVNLDEHAIATLKEEEVIMNAQMAQAEYIDKTNHERLYE